MGFAMNKLLFIIPLLLCFQSDTVAIPWQENQGLKWTNFQGKPDDTSGAVAVTASGITFSYAIEKSSIHGVIGFKTKTLAHFHPALSWYKKAQVNAAVLKHEQYHFNITELHTRYLREQLSKIQVSDTVAIALSKAHEQANLNLEAMQQHYDAESNYSMDPEGQKKWETFVNKELKRLENYKSKL